MNGKSLQKYDTYHHDAWPLWTQSLTTLLRDFNSFPDSYVPVSANRYQHQVRETPESFVIEVELPRFKKQDIKVSTENNKLTIEASRRENDVTYSYSRTFTSDILDPETVKAQLQDGVLTLTIPKAEKQKRREITIQ